MATLQTILIIFEVLLIFNLLIGVHELGHFLAAKWRGLKIDRFAIWFGKPIWKARIKGVEYALGWIPAGGYVALPQMATMEAIEGTSESPGEPLPPISPLDKIIVAFAGPLFSLLLAVAFAFVVWGVGKPVSQGENTTTVGWADPDGPAWEAGLRPGDKIIAVDGYPVTKYAAASDDSLTWRIVTSEKDTIEVTYVRDGVEYTTQVTPYYIPTKWYERRSLRKIMITPETPAIIYEVASNSPAALAGLIKGDQIVAVNGEKIHSFMPIVQAEQGMTNGPLEPLTLMVTRNGEEFERTITPEKPVQPANSRPSLGIMSWQGETNIALVHPTPLAQIKDSAGQIFATLGALFRSPDIGPQQLGGAVMIMRVYKDLFESEQGWRLVLWFSVLLNVNLALLNLLPFPVLDGGHITLAIVEGIRRRPVSARVLGYLQTACALLLIGFMLFIAFFDTGDWIRSARKDRAPVVFAPK